ncbi:MAG: tRNA (N6-threonylcarbamoyladenosine(37)-N6)-methyltransferase TrmO [Eubacteriales bacterium]|nr:tRNA (N6-threonylcarbamoyladenosine(37)-N6)-methyltransferase TrmO [Eubacteriales bacterium]
MNENLIVVARIHTDFPEKFGIPRQSGLVSTLRGEIHFEGVFRNPDAVRGIEEYSHLWLLWGFSEAKKDGMNLTVAPPRLGGKERKGVFATRSPFRPNSIGLSSVRLEEVRYGEGGEPVLVVSGADLLDGTPIYDIKPYLPYTDSHPEAEGSFGEAHKKDGVEVIFPEELRQQLPGDLQQTVLEVLSQDPRAAYNKKPDYVYGMSFAGYDIRFVVKEDVLIVKEIADRRESGWKRVK